MASDQLLKKQLRATAADALRADALDVHETAAPYRKWTPGIRTLVRLRYLKLKQAALVNYQRLLRYDVVADELQDEILEELETTTRRHSLWPALLHRVVMIPIMLATVAAVIYALVSFQKNTHRNAVFADDIPSYSDAVYRLKAQQTASRTNTNFNPEKLAKIEKETADLKRKILYYYEDQPAIAEPLETVLDLINEPDIPADEFNPNIKKLNDALFTHDIPYYLSFKSEAADCNHLPLEAFMQRLFGDSNTSGDICTVYAITSFKVEDYRYYNADTKDHLAYFTRRVDELEFNDNILGKVHIGDDSAQILLGNIESSSVDTVTAVRNGLIKTKLIPKGMPDVYGLESIAKRLQTRVLTSYVEEHEKSTKWRIERLWNRLQGKKATSLVAAAARLRDRMAEVTAFHEVQHLVDQHNRLAEPPWFEEAVNKVSVRAPIEGIFRKHVLWELSAFFTHMANAGELKGIMLNDFTSITLDPTLQDQPHYYSIRILLPILKAELEGTLGDTAPPPALTLSDIAKAYKALAKHSDQLDTLAISSYQKLFGQPLPDIAEIAERVARIDLRRGSAN